MDFRHLIVTCLFSKLRLPFDNQKVKENYAIFSEKTLEFSKKTFVFSENSKVFFFCIKKFFQEECRLKYCFLIHLSNNRNKKIVMANKK